MRTMPVNEQKALAPSKLSRGLFVIKLKIISTP
jgi:hypothetical protein